MFELTGVVDMGHIQVGKMTVDDLAPSHIAEMYHEAFRRYGVLCMWSTKEIPEPTIYNVLDTASRLKRKGNMRTRAFAVEIEEAVNAIV